MQGVNFHRPFLYPKQMAAIYEPRRYSLIEASTKAGKAQPLDSLVYTPHGPKRMGDIKIGDPILSPNGVTCVVGIYPQGVREVLRVTFSDGQSVEADAEHLWEVHEFRRSPSVVTTEQLQQWPVWRLRRAWVPEIEPAAFEARPVRIDPYALGLLIGDGGLTGETVKFSSADAELLSALAGALPAGHELRHNGRHDWVVTAGRHAAVLREAGTHLRGMLQLIGLTGKGSHEKFVPDAYRYNSVDVRLAVLQGIFDTDGFVDKHGQPAIEQTSERLADDITELVQSLGGSILTRLRVVNGYRDKNGRFIQCRPVWRQVVRMADGAQLFRLSRKRDKCRSKRKSGHRMFRSIEFARHAETQCIKVADERALYLTDGFVPTHNTAGCIVWITEQAMKGRDGWNYWWVAPVSGQAYIAFDRCRRACGADCKAFMSPFRIVMPNGAIIWFKSGDKPDSLYGEDVYAAVVDEASRLKEGAWYAVRSTLTATRGPVRIIGNVKGRKNWFYRMARRAEQMTDMPNGNMAYHKIVAHDAVRAGVLAQEEITDAEQQMPDHVFRELYLAEPSEDGGNPFGEAAIDRCTVGALYKGVPWVFGIDLAKSIDYTVVIGITREGYVCRFERWNKCPWEETEKRILSIIGTTPALVDSTGVGDPIVERLQKRTHAEQVTGFVFSTRSKQQLMEGLAAGIQSGNITYPDGEIVLELKQFEYEMVGKEGRFTGVRYSAPAGFHDDCVMALALAYQHKSARTGTFVSDATLAAVAAQGSRRRGF